MIETFKQYKILTAVAALSLFSSLSFASPDRLKEEQGKLSSLQEELDAVKLKLEFTDIKVRDTKTSVRKLDDRVARQKERVRLIQEELDHVTAESASTSRAIDELAVKLKAGEAKYNNILGRFRQRLVHLHKTRQGTLLDSIFSAKDLNSFLNRYQMVRYLLLQDRGTLEELRKVKNDLNADAEALRQKQARLTELAATTGNRREDLLIETSSLAAMLQALVMEKKLLISRQDKLKKTMSDLENAIAGIEGTRAQDPRKFETSLGKPNAASLKAPPNNRPTPPYTSTPEPLVELSPAPDPASKIVQNSTGYGETQGAVFQWPLKTFKVLPPEKPDGEPNALELFTSEPADVFAIAPGKVLFNGPMADLGNVIIIGHKNGFTSVYGRLPTIWVGLGQMVETGEVIGQTSGQARPLHLEIRLVGKNQNPLHFLVKK